MQKNRVAFICGVVNERWLCHGTGEIDSDIICEGDIGFDVGCEDGDLPPILQVVEIIHTDTPILCKTSRMLFCWLGY